ncbi:Aste57867_18382 [Aphanomyces stellatus]|uniref:Aste57867_18382 protein n=1 Tax=Aphanomyces stellatus TaxID=120398 RepID=A0A485LA72_9STRA|nr:hypothetical protein As57867_018320 [Aphanomyces stellatus]VFT95118.1 Aste57867_18382 [Aphanomyces stellatus]
MGTSACHGFRQALDRYTRMTPSIRLYGPTDLAPVIRETIAIAKRTRKYHILVIIANGQVMHERETRAAIEAASHFAMCMYISMTRGWATCCMVGVGDGPWDMMEKFDDGLPHQQFDNFQFVEYIRSFKMHRQSPEVGFATDALMDLESRFQVEFFYHG